MIRQKGGGMRRIVLAVIILGTVCFMYSSVCAEDAVLIPDKIKAIAVKAVDEKGIKLDEADIIYDEGNKLFVERLGLADIEDKTPNYGILKRGFLKNYCTVYFDFKEPLEDVWVFVDKDTGEVLEVYSE